jgi:hypothetical protein
MNEEIYLLQFIVIDSILPTRKNIYESAFA